MYWLIRSVRASRWRNGAESTISDEKLQSAAADLTPRPRDNGGLSVYAVSDDRDEKFTGILHVVLLRKPETVHFLRIQPHQLTALNLEIKCESSPDQHPHLRERHRNIYGLDDTHLRERLAHAILSGTPRLLTLTSGEIKSEGRKLLKQSDYAGYVAFPAEYQQANRL